MKKYLHLPATVSLFLGSLALASAQTPSPSATPAPSAAPAPDTGAAGATETAAPAKKGPFVKADTNGDGKLSLEEFTAAVVGRMDADAAKAKFAELDTDHNGFLSRKEFLAGAKALRKNENN